MKILILIIGLILCNPLYSQQLRSEFTHFTQKDGLPSDEAHVMLQDHLGYIWIGSNNGLTRYDGYELSNISVVNGDSNFLQLPLVTELYEDSKHNIWIGSVGGITKYSRDKGTFRLYSFSEIETQEERTFLVLTICETQNGDILIGMGDFYYRELQSGILVLKKGADQFEPVKFNDNQSSNIVIQISRLENDRYLVGGLNGFGEFDYLEKSISWFPIKKDLRVASFLRSGNDKVWLGTINDELLNYDLGSNSYEVINIPNELKIGGNFHIVNIIIYDQNNNLLMPTNFGLLQYDINQGKFSKAPFDNKNPSALHSSDISDILLDKTGTLWVSTNNAGISKYNLVQNSFESYKHSPDNPKSISPGWAARIFEYNENELWFNTQGNILSRFNKTTKNFINQSLPMTSYIEFIYRDKSDQIWIAGGNDLFKYSKNKSRLKNVNIPLNQNAIHVLFEDSRNTFWIGTHFGLFTYDRINNLTAKVDFQNLEIGSLGSNTVYFIVEDNSQNLWFGTDDGLFKYDTKEKHYSRLGNSSDSTKSLNSQDINALYYDKSGFLWAGTWLGGLNKIDLETGIIKSYSKKEGFISHSVQGILGDEENGTLWLSSFDGISRFDIENESFQNFGIEDGIQGNQFAHQAALKTTQGEFVFGGQNGVTIFKPEDIKSDIVPPEVLITDFKLFNESILPGENTILEQPINKTEKINLNYNENDISIEFLAVHYANPSKNKYAYKLENYENDWRIVGNQRTAVYPNLPPGEYKFHVKASNNNDVWNEEPRTLSIIIESPPWATWWAYSSYLLLFIAFLYSLRKVEITRQKKNAEIKESKLQAESAELYAKAAEAQAKVIQAENDRKTKELEEARELQLSMLPKELPQLPNLDIAVYMKTATEVGGDYYDFHIALDGTLTVVLGDATGHGMKAGTMVTTTKSLFNVLAPNPNIKDTFHEMTRCLKLMHLEKLSMCMTMLKISSNKMEMSAAGMPPIYIYRCETNTVEEHVFKGMPLGTMLNFPYSLESSELNKGDTILLMSDGFPELMNDSNKMIGFQKTRNLFEDNGESTPEEIISKFKNYGSDWVNDRDPDDDVTFVVIKVK